jgi:hypothetical protein
MTFQKVRMTVTSHVTVLSHRPWFLYRSLWRSLYLPAEGSSKALVTGISSCVVTGTRSPWLGFRAQGEVLMPINGIR